MISGFFSAAREGHQCFGLLLGSVKNNTLNTKVFMHIGFTGHQKVKKDIVGGLYSGR